MEKNKTQRIKRNSSLRNINSYPHLTFTSSQEFPEIYERWNKHLKRFEDNQSSEFKEKRYKIAQIETKNIKKLYNSLQTSKRISYSVESCDEDYVASKMNLGKERLWAKWLPNFKLNEDQLKLAKEIAEEMKPEIESCIGNFRIINTKASETPHMEHLFGPNCFHTDSQYPIGTYKAFVYLTPPNRDRGTSGIYLPRTEDDDCEEYDLVLVEGELGTFLFFDPIFHTHSGFVPVEPYVRMMLEFIIVPSEETVIEPSFHGTNSTHPICP
jgi:hypothetical protein